MTYSAKIENTVITADPSVTLRNVSFAGPGQNQYTSVIVWRESDQETIARMLARAYAAGKADRSREIRDLLGSER